MSPLMSITGYSDSLVRSLRSVLRRHYFFVGSDSAASGFAVLVDCWREPLHTLLTSMPGGGCKQKQISWLKSENLKNMNQVMVSLLERDSFL
ncbi:hypothetical protein TNCT_25871 [Trichonephila clavata]|uniref:Uncharacterized protein n=1 Tax=Trichonephila clavata TaxID=2740835 RepID=A0A8X6LJB6_TRICU|nr:hypothetical protein TNCT_25871 [Trichonephila clavata]